MDTNKKEIVLDEIKKIDSQIVLLINEKKKLAHELNNLGQDNVNVISIKNLESQNSSKELSQADKITLFRSLFRGRDDVHARLWTSRKTGRSGYSPVCKNEWVGNICKKPTIKCSECPNRELIPLSDEIIYKHIRGTYVVGIYPMLKNEHCHFLVVDFDKEGWKDNVFAFKNICNQEGVPIAIERSRSGNGAHVWLFFKEEIPAMLARKMGCFLITRTMDSRYQLDMKSYDRLFPNQDTLPKGGFGNLIALPFQRDAVRYKNTLFIDKNCEPYSDQWSYLSKIDKMSYCDVERIVKGASKNGLVIGVRAGPITEEDLPWERLPSGRRKYKPVITDLPERIELVIANKIYIKIGTLPSVLLNQIKQLAAFQNPEFYRRQNMRLSTFLTPRIICCSEIIDGYLSIPRGCLDDILYMMNEYNIKVEIKDERISGKKIKCKFYGELSNEQKMISKKILKGENGVLVSSPGSGKTIIAIHTIAKRKINTLILVHRKPLLEQWKLQLSTFLGIDLKNIGQIGAGKDKTNGLLDIAMIQSMEKKGSVDDRIADYGYVIIDECHHVSAVSFERVLIQAKARHILGLTATPYRRDGHQPIIHMQCGPISYQTKNKDITEQTAHKYFVVPRMTTFTCEWSSESNIYDLWPKLIADEKRNSLIVEDILKTVKDGRFPIILTERREHLNILTQMLKNEIEFLVVLHGGINTKIRKESLKTIHNNSSGSKRAILATGAYIGEGFDEPLLDTLFITMPISFRGKVIQYAGRLNRRHENKNNVMIYDYVDKEVPVLWKMYQRRIKTYGKLGYLDKNELTIPDIKQGNLFGDMAIIQS